MPGPNPYAIIPSTPTTYMRGPQNGCTQSGLGPFENAGTKYIISLPFTLGGLHLTDPCHLAAYSSTDEITWTEQDSANAPTCPTTGGNPSPAFSVFYPDTGGTVIYVAFLYQDTYLFTGGYSQVGLWSFDMATNTWTQIALGGPQCFVCNSTLSTNPIYLLRTSTGKFVILYQVLVAVFPSLVFNQANVYAVEYAGGWGTPQLLGQESFGSGPGVIANGCYPALVGITSADVGLLLWASQTDNKIYVNTYSGGVFSAKSQALPWPTSPTFGSVINENGFPGATTPWIPVVGHWGDYNALGKFVSSANQIGWCLPFFHNPPGGTGPGVFFNFDITMLVADTSVSPPTFTTNIIASSVNVGTTSGPLGTDFFPNSSGGFTAMWSRPNVQKIDQATASSLLGPWSASSTYWDAALNPPVPGPIISLNELSTRQLSTSIGVVGGVTTNALGTGQSYNLVGAALLVVTCPIGSAALNIPYTGTIVASGGTGPYTFAIISGSLPPGLTLDPATGIITGIPTLSRTYAFTVQATDSLGATATADCSIVIPPVPTTGGRGFIKVIVNHFDTCLGRDYLLYKKIDRELLKCGVKPFCFCIDERDWGGNFSEHEEVPMGPPEGAIAFNPTGAISLPTAASGDNTIFTLRVPIGYDGVILGQYHGYIAQSFAAPPPIFVEGSGDLVWRLESAGRCMRDCGLMEVSLGSLQNMSPIAGGLQIRSGDLIQYIVAAPNPSGTLVPGIGNIVAGLHGWWWPRH